MVDLAVPGDERQQVMRGGFGTKAEALTAMTQVQQERLEGTYIAPSKLTLGEYLLRWQADIAEDVRPNTVDE